MSDLKKDPLTMGAAKALGLASKAAGGFQTQITKLQSQVEKFAEPANDGAPLDYQRKTTNDYRLAGAVGGHNQIRFNWKAIGIAAAPYLITEIAASLVVMRLCLTSAEFDQFFTISLSKLAVSSGVFDDLTLKINTGAAVVERSVEDLARMSNTWSKHLPWIIGSSISGILPAYVVGRWWDKKNIRRGMRMLESEHVRGAKVTDAEGLNRVIQLYEEDQKVKGLYKKPMIDLELGGVRLPSMREIVGFLIFGTTGSGKTVAFKAIARQVRKVRQKMILHDPAPEFVKCMYEQGDIVFNPYDARFLSDWDIWGELRNDYDYKAFATALVTVELKNPWIGENARLVLAGLLQKTRSFEELDAAIKSDAVSLEALLIGTDAQGLISSNPKSAATVQPILSKLRTSLSIFGKLKSPPKGTKKFSFRDWVSNNDDRRWIFLTNRADQRELLNPLFSLVFDIIARELLSQVPNDELPEDQRRRVWIVQEEAACLPSIPAWPDLTAQGRKVGACWITMIQDPAQLEAEDKYGKEKAKALYQNHNTWLIFRSTNAETATLISDQIGTYEQWEKQESISAGPDGDDPDGRNWRAVLQERQAILPSEIQTLPDLHCFLMMFGPTPAAKITIPWVQMDNITPSFVPASWLKIDGAFGDVIDGEAVVVDDAMEALPSVAGVADAYPVQPEPRAEPPVQPSSRSPIAQSNEVVDLDMVLNGLLGESSSAKPGVEEIQPLPPPKEAEELDDSWMDAFKP